MVAIILVTYLDLVKGYGMSSLEKGGLFPVWLLFFVMGVYLGNRKERAYRLWPWLFVMGIGLFLSFLETKWLYPLYHMGYGIKASAHLYSLAVIMVLFSEKTQRKFTSFGLWFRLLVWLGQISFGIYLIHCFFIMVLSRLPFHWDWFSQTFVV